ncbi:MAG: zinc ABC transporter substrate-binding protein [Deltaproteobacteria bacterium]|nr:zinc ABC transporter substrate-binding protein [Deltaproteobacteria bacterium]
MRMRRYLAILPFLFVVGLSPAARAALRVVTSIPDFGAIAGEIGGGHVEVTALVKPTQDPHFLDAKPSLELALNRADLLLVAGMELEAGWLPALVAGARNAAIQRGGKGYLDCSTLIPPMEVMAVDRAKGDIHPGGNPHYWIDPRNGLRLAQGITKKLGEIDPDHGADYAAGYARFAARLKDRMAKWQLRLAPQRGTRVVAYHRSWIYFLDWAGFVAVGELEPKPGIPPKASHVAELITAVRGQNVKYLVQEAFYPTQLSQIFADKTGAKLKVLPTMVGAAGTHTYFDVIERLVEELTS